MLEFVDSDLYFVQDKDNFINPLLQVESVEKSTGSGGPKITGSGSSSLACLSYPIYVPPRYLALKLYLSICLLTANLSQYTTD